MWNNLPERSLGEGAHSAAAPLREGLDNRGGLGFSQVAEWCSHMLAGFGKP